MNRRPRIGITAGDPAGIGPEITAKAAGDAERAQYLRAGRVRADE